MSDRARASSREKSSALTLLATALADAVQGVAPEPAVRDRMRARILAACTSSAASDASHAARVQAGTQVRRASEGDWLPVFPGVMIRHLSVDTAAGVQMALWRLDAGAKIPSHSHRLAEECLVVEGSILHAGETFGSGDFLHAVAGSPHDVFESPGGALLLIRGELPPARLVTPPAGLTAG